MHQNDADVCRHSSHVFSKRSVFFNSRMDEIQTFKVLVIAVNQIERLYLDYAYTLYLLKENSSV